MSYFHYSVCVSVCMCVCVDACESVRKEVFLVMLVWYNIQHFFSRLPWLFVQIYSEKQPSQTMLPNCLTLLKADCRTEVYHRVSVKL